MHQTVYLSKRKEIVKKLIDMTHRIRPDMPVYPGTESPTFSSACTIERDGFEEKKITMYSHTGTHMDAPAHIIKEAMTLDRFPVNHFMGKGFLVPVNGSGKDNRKIDINDIRPFQKSIEKSNFVLFYTGWSKFWNSDDYFDNYPVLSCDAAEWLSQFELKGVGVDAISFDETTTSTFPVHKTFLSHNIVIIENLTNLNQLENTPEFIFTCFPLNVYDADGGPVRAVALVGK